MGERESAGDKDEVIEDHLIRIGSQEVIIEDSQSNESIRDKKMRQSSANMKGFGQIGEERNSI